MPAINQVQPVQGEIVLQERVVTNEFMVTEIFESIRDRYVRVDVELGPFTTQTKPDGEILVRGTGRRGLMVWDGQEYDAIRDTWSNSDLMAALRTKLLA